MNLKLAKLLRSSALVQTKGLIPTSYLAAMKRPPKHEEIDHFEVDPKCTRGVYRNLKKEFKNG